MPPVSLLVYLCRYVRKAVVADLSLGKSPLEQKYTYQFHHNCSDYPTTLDNLLPAPVAAAVAVAAAAAAEQSLRRSQLGDNVQRAENCAVKHQPNAREHHGCQNKNQSWRTDSIL